MRTKWTPNKSHIERFDFACKLAREVGLQALKYWQDNGAGNLEASNKGLQDFVTVADKAAEDAIRSALSATFPLDGFVGEETGGEPGSAGYWVVDPIDGTANYMRGLRHWGVSIAYVEDGQTIIGVIHDTPTNRIYAAMRGAGATRDGEKIEVATTGDPHRSVGIIGHSRRTSFDIYLNQLRALHGAGIEHRKIGSAAIGIVRVAEGVADYYYEKYLNCWDALAALLIAEEAGAHIVAPQMERFIPHGGEVFCSAPKLATQLEELLLGR